MIYLRLDTLPLIHKPISGVLSGLPDEDFSEKLNSAKMAKVDQTDYLKARKETKLAKLVCDIPFQTLRNL